MGLTDYTFGDKRIWNAGREYEQERIIKLLPQIIEMGNVADVFDLQDFMPAIMRDAIALIKGEK